MFTFVREEVAREVHSGDEPAAAVARGTSWCGAQDALDTAQECEERYEVRTTLRGGTKYANADEQQRLPASARHRRRVGPDQLDCVDPPMVRLGAAQPISARAYSVGFEGRQVLQRSPSRSASRGFELGGDRKRDPSFSTVPLELGKHEALSRRSPRRTGAPAEAVLAVVARP